MGCSGSKRGSTTPNTKTSDNGAVPKDKQHAKIDKNTTKSQKSQALIDDSTDNVDYEQVDQHARKAPAALKESIEDLVNYLSKPSKQPKMIVRAFFVWMSENIKMVGEIGTMSKESGPNTGAVCSYRYDADGYFGRAEQSPCDALSVIKNGKSVCEGYANVMEALCRQAKINIKKISGFAKGVGYSADHVITTKDRTNHAWNAIEIDNKWFLVDGTWGAGHMNKLNAFEKKFEDFYFLTDPNELINSHFPYMDGDMTSSMQWQLRKKPVSLDEFSKTVQRWPISYKFQIQALSHPHGYFKVSGRFEITFKIDGREEVEFSESLKLYDGNFIQEIENTTFGQREGDIYKVKVSPPKVGKYDLNFYVRRAGEEGQLTSIFKYLFECSKVVDTEKFPKAYIQAQRDRCILHQPLNGILQPNSQVKISLSSNVLVRVMVNKMHLEKKGGRFEGTVTTGASGTIMGVFGSKNNSGSLDGLFNFKIV